jgi:hypothetical protein
LPGESVTVVAKSVMPGRAHVELLDVGKSGETEYARSYEVARTANCHENVIAREEITDPSPGVKRTTPPGACCPTPYRKLLGVANGPSFPEPSTADALQNKGMLEGSPVI